MAHAVSIGAGPAIDVRLGLEQLDASERRRVTVSLLDMDPAALEFAATSLHSLIAPDRLRLCRENLFRLPRLARVQATLADADFISCPGLFDYLDRENATAMLSCFWRHLCPGGEAVAFNFAPDNSSRAYMEWIGNWYLTYRDRSELLELARAAVPEEGCLALAEQDSRTSLYVVCAKP
jgi:O-methyltransferase involved in polyketide biosynthesis